MKTYIQILGTAGTDNTPSFLIFFDNARYLFGCGEGTQRFCTEHKVRLSKVQHIFLTQLSWEQLGGLPGMLLSMADVGVKVINVHGPPNTLNLLAATRYFIHRGDMTLNVDEFPAGRKYSDANLSITPVFIGGMPPASVPPLPQYTPKEPSDQDGSIVQPNPTTGIVKLALSSFAYKRKATTQDTKETTGTVGSDTDAAPVAKELSNKKLEPFPRFVPATKPSPFVVSYICQTADIPGKFDPKKAAQLNIPKGPLFGRLQKGESIVLPDGTTVNPNQCIGPATPGPVTLLIHCPTAAHITELINHSGWVSHKGPTTCAVIHWACIEALASPEYRAWMGSFAPSTQHILVNAQLNSQRIVFTHAARNHAKIHQLDGEVFPLPWQTVSADEKLFNQLGLAAMKNVVVAEHMLKYTLSPVTAQGLDRTELVPPVDWQEAVKDLETNEEWKKAFVAYSEWRRTAASGALVAPAGPADSFEIVFLGTGAALPSKYRNVSATYVHTANSEGFLLDAGEGTLGQMYRKYGTRTDELILNLRVIFISHIHADHHLGAVRIIVRRHQLANAHNRAVSPLVIVCPSNMHSWLLEYAEIEPLHYQFVDCYKLQGHPLLEAAGLAAQSVPVIHCPNAYGFVISFRGLWKIVYSGDTRPCERLIDAGKGAQLLIHEATFEDSMPQDALDKNHSTTGEAIASAKRMGAQFLAMNHFSQRYPRVPSFDDSSIHNVAIAFDLMTMQFRHFDTIPKMLPCLKNVFTEEMEEDEAE